MIGSVIWLIVGLILILVGANILTDGASAIAKRMVVSDLVVGLTIVAFGTSAPELVISVISAMEGSAPLAVGNVVGSNIFNLLMIIGVTALVRPIKVERNVLTMEIPMVVLCSVLLLMLGNSSALTPDPVNQVSRLSGLFLIIFFLLFLRYTFATAKGNPTPLPAENDETKEEMKIGKAVLYIVLGLAGLIYGGDRFVEGATGIALGLGISESVVGLTIVAGGTSLPELATSIVAALKGKPGLAVGNVIGSNIFNTLLVLGVASTITPLPFGAIGNFDLLTLLGASVAVWVFGWFFRKRTFTRIEGLLLALAYVAYIVKLVLMENS